MDQNSKKWIDIKIKSVVETSKFNQKEAHVLAYYPKKEDGKLDMRGYHCVFVKRLISLKKQYECVNSWGWGSEAERKPFPLVETKRKGNKLWEIAVEWKIATEG